MIKVRRNLLLNANPCKHLKSKVRGMNIQVRIGPQSKYFPLYSEIHRFRNVRFTIYDLRFLAVGHSLDYIVHRTQY